MCVMKCLLWFDDASDKLLHSIMALDQHGLFCVQENT